MFALVDCNNFYASCERVFNPALVGRPVVVLSNNDGCVIARSEEAKVLGIGMGAPAFKCRELLLRHGVAVFSSNYPLYGDMSSRVMTTLAGFAPSIEVYSIDESFLDLSGFGRFDLECYGSEIRRTVRRHTGIPVGVGIAATKTLAKIANRIAKKHLEYDGVCVLERDAEIQRALKLIAVGDIWGVGRQWASFLQTNGIDTAADFAAASPAWIRQHMHVTGARVQAELNGRSCLALEAVRSVKKSICTSRSFGRTVRSKEALRQAVATFAGRCALKLRREGLRTSLVTVFAATSRFSHESERYWGTRTLALQEPSQDSIVLLNVAEQLLDALYQPGYEYRKAGVLLAGLNPADAPGAALSLFPEASCTRDGQHRKLMQIMDAVNRRYGHGTIHLAAEETEAWKPLQKRLSPRYTTRWSEILEVHG